MTDERSHGEHEPSAQLQAPAMRRRKICILGASLDVGNQGVRALAVSLAQVFASTARDPELTFLYWNKTGGTRCLRQGGNEFQVAVRNCRLSPSSAVSEHILAILGCALLYRLGLHRCAEANPWLSSVLEADLIGDIQGGDSFSDIYGVKRFLLGILPLLSVILLGRPYVMLPQTYGPFRNRLSRILAAFMLRRATTLLTRDQNCQTLLANLCGRSATFCPDVAFCLEAVQPKNLSTLPDQLDVQRESFLVGINVSGLLYMGGYTHRNMFRLGVDYRVLVDRLVDALLSRTAATVLIVPHVHGEREIEASSAVMNAAYEKHPGRVYALATALNESQLKWVIGQTQFFIGSRMHACIAALSQGVPAVGLAYSDKFLGVFESAGVGGAVVDLRTVTADRVLKHVLSAIAQRGPMASALKERATEIESTVRLALSDLLPQERVSSPLHALAPRA